MASEDVVVDITQEEQQHLLDSLRKITTSPYDEPEEFMLDLYPSFVGRLPRNTIKAIRRFKEDPKATGYLVLRGFPVDPDLPPTKNDGSRNPDKKTYVSEGCVLGTSLFLGEAYCMEQVKKGLLVQSLTPVEAQFSSQSNEGYGTELRMHTEFAFHPFRPHFFVLFCLRPDIKGESLTYVTINKHVVRMLSLEDRQNLSNPNFIIESPQGFMAPQVSTVRKPILIGPDELPELVLALHSKIIAPSPECDVSLKKLASLIESNQIGLHLRQGDLLLIDNRKVMHGRSVFTCAFDGSDRWLQRTHIRTCGLWRENLLVKYPCRNINILVCLCNSNKSLCVLHFDK